MALLFVYHNFIFSFLKYTKSWSVTQEFAKAAAYLCDLTRWLLQYGGFGLLQPCSPTYVIWLTIVDLLYYSEKLRPGEGHLMSIQYMIFQLQKVLLFLTKYENVKKCSYKSPFIINMINLGVSSQSCVSIPGLSFEYRIWIYCTAVWCTVGHMIPWTLSSTRKLGTLVSNEPISCHKT